MSQACTKLRLRISLLVLLFPLICFSQAPSFDTAGFYKHLVGENLYQEQIAFAKQIERLHSSDKKLQDSLNLGISLAYFKSGNIDSSGTSLVKISPDPLFSPSSAKTYLSLLILGKQYDQADRFLKKCNYADPVYFNEASLSLTMLEHGSTREDTSVSMFSSTITDIKRKYENQPRHSGFLAGLYSAIIPGMGKLYLGYKQEALSAFIENVLLGGQAAESYIKAGPLSARFIITGTLFGLFYGGNIWGSAILAKKQKRDRRKQIDYEIFNYYNTRVSSGTY